ncbi:MAG: hypothetical protein HYX74_01610 [Acidobacteria bacterium]|nr:hypothetical protein [Acidobacteriota bacterium]
MKKQTIGAVAATVGLLLLGAYWLGPTRSAPAAPGEQSSGWVTHKNPFGFAVEHPPGWRVSADGRSGRVDLQGSEGEQVIIWPVFLPSSLNSGSAAAVLQKLTASLGLDSEWGVPREMSVAVVRLDGHSATRVAASVFTWAGSSKGTAGYLYLTSAPEVIYPKTVGTFGRVLRSFRVLGAASDASEGGQEHGLTYVRWNDPRENAFSLEVPSQWRTSGGLFRFAPVDTRGAWETVSPDGLIRITGGDPELPTHTEPNQMLAMAGFLEGSWYSPGYGVQMLVRRYVPGAAFSREYATTRGAPGCSGARIAEVRERPEAVAAINSIYSQFGMVGVSLYLTAGETAFTCNRQGQSMAGYYFAATQRVQPAGMPGGIWNAEYLFGYLAAEGKAPLAQSVLDHILKSIQINPQWAAMQQNVAANTSQIVSRTHAEVSDIISSTYWNRQDVMDEISRRRSNAILGVLDVIDPVSGRELKVENSSNYFWIDHRGMIVGTETDTRPDIDFREMIQLP